MNRIVRTSAGRVSALLTVLTIGLAGLVSFNVVVESRSPEQTALSPAASLAGPVLEVDRTDDNASATGCSAAPNDCSLRGAIIAANAVSGTTISLPGGTYKLTLAGASEQFAATGDLDVRGNFTTIIGADKYSTIIEQSTPDRVFEINPALLTGFNFSISGVTITGGNRTTGSGGGMISGGPSNSTTITDCIFENNNVTGAVGANGGAISDSSSSGPSNIKITNTIFRNNTARTGAGGAIRFNSTGKLTITGSTFIGNRSITNNGGAISVLGPGSGGTYDLSQNSFENNQALGANGRGGAVFSGDGILTVKYNRLVGNTAGAGIGTSIAYSGSVGSVSLNDNWWGANSGPAPASVFGAFVTSFLVQRFTAPSQVQIGAEASIVTDILGTSAGGPIDAANLAGLPPFPLTPGTIFENPAPQFGTISGAATQFVNGQATAKYTAGNQGGSDDLTATADAETLTATISVIEPATISCPGNITAQTSPGECTASVSFQPSAAGFPIPAVTCSIGSTPITSPHAFPVGTTTVTCKASNGANEDASCTFTVTVTDENAPVLTTPSNVTVNTGADAESCGAFVSDATLGTATATESCGGAASVTRTGVPAGNNFPVGATTVTYTATGANGSSTSATQTVTVVDNTAPKVTAPANASYECAADVPAGNASQASATDNCGTANVTLTESNNGGVGSAANPLIITRVYKATDGAGNTASATQTITVIDNTAPTLTVPAPITLSADGSCQAAVPNVVASSAATDNCAGSVTITQSPAAGTSLGLGTHTITVTATDAAGNAATKTTSLTIADTTAPSVTAPSNVTVNTGAEANTCGTLVSDATLGSATTSDNCGGTVTVTRTGVPAGNIFPVGTTTVTYTATDAHGNSSTATQTVTVVDKTAPTITAPANATYECAANVPAGNASQASASDNCGTANVTFTESSNGGAGSVASPLVITRIFTATDAAGNTSSATQTITVIDHTAPVLLVAAPVTVSADSSCQAAVPNMTASSTASDNCGGSVSITQSPAAGTTLGLGTHTITVTATDAAGNSSSGTTIVTIVDTTAPSVTAPSNVTVNTGSSATSCEAFISDAALGSAITSDNCGGAVNVTRSGVPAGNLFPVGSTTITYTATDANGNTSTATQTVTVVDSTAATVTAPANATYECAADVPAGNANQATASDNCGSANVTMTESNNGGTGSTASPLVITRVYTATDGAGNTASATQTITVVDTTAPTLSVPAPTTVSADSYCQATVPNVVASSTASDNCAGSVTITQSPSAGTALGLGTHTITVTATDAAGNTKSATTSLTIVDTTAPSLTAPASITVPTGSGSSCSVFISDAQLGTASSSDNCSGSVSVTRSGVPAGNVFPVGQTTITYTATDAAGNTTTATQVVNVADGTAPVITLNGPNPLIVECHTAFVDRGATANDNCGGSFAATASGTVNPNVPGTYTITYSATDASGNQATPVTRTVIVQDSTAPVITIKTQPISLWSPNHRYQTVQVTDLVQSVADSCNNSIGISNVVIASVTSDEADDSDGDGNTRNDMIIAADCKSVQLRAERNGGSNGRVYTITLRVRDSAGNVGTATKQVTVPTTQNGAAAIDDGPRNIVTGNCP